MWSSSVMQSVFRQSHKLMATRRVLSGSITSHRSVRSAVSPDDIEQFHYVSSNMFPKIRNFIIQNNDENVPICNHKPFNELKAMLHLTNDILPNDPLSNEQLEDEIDVILNYSPRSGKARYVDKLYSGSDAITQFATYLLQTINNNCHTYHSSQILTIIEHITIKNLCNIFYKQTESPYGGVFLPGGAYSNCIAFRLARDKYFPSISTHGLSTNGISPIVLTSDQSHYSVMTSVQQIGIGSNNVIKLQTKENGTIDIEKCEILIENLINEKKKPFILSCNAGTTVLGAFDNFREISRICDKYDIWMHVDGCWGGGAAFGRESAVYNNKIFALFDGVELADSISFDAHKLLSTGLLCGCLLLRDEGYLYKSCEPPNAKYLFHGDENEVNYDIGLKTLQCGRQCDALKLYLSWIYYGKNGLCQRVENAFHNADYLCKLIEESDDFILVQEPQFCNVCFWYLDPKDKKRFDLNDEGIVNMLESNTKKIYSKLEEEANSMVDYSPYKGLPTFFRMITSNYRLTTNDIDIILKDIRNAAQQLV